MKGSLIQAYDTPIARPETRYARNGEAHIAYQVFGEGDLDFLHVPGFSTHVELLWEHEPTARFLEGLASFARVINFDRRGSGLSDPVADAPTLEQRMDDVRAVMDAAGSERAALVGVSEGVPMSILFAATYPQRVRALVCTGGMARSTYAEDYPWGTPEQALVESGLELILPHWGDGSLIEVSSPSQADNRESRAFYGRLERSTASPGMLTALFQMFLDLDVRAVVPSVHAPALVLHRSRDRLVDVRHGRWLAEHMPDARMVEFEGDDHGFWYESTEEWLGEVQEFLTGARAAPDVDRVLATVLFTDIVDSTRAAADLGDRRWRELLERHQRAVREALDRFDGREVKSTGDGFLATFDGPARDQLRDRDPPILRGVGDQRSRRPPHRRVRGDGRGHRRHRRPYRRPRQRSRRTPGAACVPNREGPGGRVRDSIHRPRRARAEGRSRHLAVVCGRRLTVPRARIEPAGE